MAFLKVLLSSIASVITFVMASLVYLFIRMRAPVDSGTTGTDITLLPSMTIFSPLYWLVVLVSIAAVSYLLARYVVPS
ncbi:MAG: hypothetical protein DMG89_00390 [Acidobacteria bacterium]|nr:MAG: hypothetical protein DMG89_00390 [Acidobacteriota bacterium]